MRIIIFGATGMVGQGALLASLAADDVSEILSIARRPTGRSHPKLREIVRPDMSDYADLSDQLRGYGACFYCLGVSSVGLDEARYIAITRDLTLAAANALLRASPEMTFVFVSGAGADPASTTMWRRVKAQTEDAVRALPFKAVYVLRPGVIQPRDGIRSRTRLYNWLYFGLGPVLALLGRVSPGLVNTTASMGAVMLRLAREGADTPMLDGSDIARLGKAAGASSV